MSTSPFPPPSRELPVAEPVALIVLRLPTAADRTLSWAALTVFERVPAWFAAANPLDAVDAPCTLLFGDGRVVDMLAGEA